MQTRRLFIAGATGAVGHTLLPLAKERGVEIVPHVRPKSAAKLTHPNAAALELGDHAKLVAAMKGCSSVVQLIGTMRKRFATGDTYETSDIGTTQQLANAAKEAGVDHFVLLSSVGAGSPVGAYLKAKARAEAIVRESGIPFTIFRPSTFEDREGKPIPAMRAVTRFLGMTRYQPISLRELASAILHVAATRSHLGEALEGASLWAAVAEAMKP